MTHGAPSNPFSTRHLALPFLTPEGEAPDLVCRLLDRLLERREGEIIGPQGTGKTTLLRALLAEASRRQLPAVLTRVPQGRRWPPVETRQFCSNLRQNRARGLLLLDSAEQLPPPVLWWLRAACRWSGAALAVTGHEPLGLPPLWHSGVDEVMAERLAREVLASSCGAPELVPPEEAREALRLARGNAREALFVLYDRYEQRWTAAPRP